jgi:hypothetical protein
MKFRTPTLLFLILIPLTAHAAPADRVILISVDGLRADLLELLLANDQVGDYANFQTDFSHTVTLPNHTCMLTGRPVLQPAGQPTTVHHGYVSNSTPGPDDTLHNSGNPYVSYIAGAFDMAHDAGLSTALYASKSKFIIFDQSWDSVDTYHYAATGSPSNASPMHTTLLADLIADPADFSFIHYRDPDSAGHASGWGSPPWVQAVNNVDAYLGDIFSLIDAGKLGSRVAVIVTTDHGGTGTGHSDATNSFVYTIPFLVWGSGVSPGQDLYALNTGLRQDPGSGRPDYNAAGQPIRNGEAGNLALDLLGLASIPGSSINAAQDLTVGNPLSAIAVAPRTGLGLNLYPNPANPGTTVDFSIGESAPVRLTVHDIRGRRVAVLADRTFPPGTHAVPFRDPSLSSGTYLVKIETPGALETRKLMLLK